MIGEIIKESIKFEEATGRKPLRIHINKKAIAELKQEMELFPALRKRPFAGFNSVNGLQIIITEGNDKTIFHLAG